MTWVVQVQGSRDMGGSGAGSRDLGGLGAGVT